MSYFKFRVETGIHSFLYLSGPRESHIGGRFFTQIWPSHWYSQTNVSRQESFVIPLYPIVTNTKDNPIFCKIYQTATSQRYSASRYYTTHCYSLPSCSQPSMSAPEKLRVVKAKFNQIMELGIIYPSNSNWASPLHLMSKSGGTWRACGDYRAPNSATKPERYPIPRIHDVTVIIHGKPIFSKLDLNHRLTTKFQ